jgi:hypothetical protein
MSTTCEHVESGAVELYFYDELPVSTRAEMASHVARCRHCAAALEDLKVIRTALSTRPDVCAPMSGDWSDFMERLDAAVLSAKPNVAPAVLPFRPSTAAMIPAPVRTYVGLLATAALLAIVTISVTYLARHRQLAPLAQNDQVAARVPADGAASATSQPASVPVATTGMRSVGEQHFERSKLVVLGLASKEPGEVSVADWAYERSLASSLLSDTRLYRLAAEERGLTSLAGVMRDLELVLLETSMAEGSDPAELPQIQRLIRKRQLIQKMDVVNTVGLLP